MRTLLVWSVVFLSGFLVAAIVLPIGRDAANKTAVQVSPAAPVSIAVPPPTPAPIVIERENAAARNNDAYYSVAVDTLDKVKYRMRDPASVTFRNLIVVHVADGSNTPESSAVCGEMNSRNGFGAYTGFVPFIAADTFMITAEETSFGALFATNCTPTQAVTALYY